MKRLLLALLTIGLLTVPSSYVQSETSKGSAPSITWSVSKDSLSISFNRVDLAKVMDYTWKGRVVTELIQEMIENGTAQLVKTSKGFRLVIAGADNELDEPGEFGVMLQSGKEVVIDMLASPIPSEKACAPSSIAPQTASCGGFYDAINPYPCCDNGSRPDGNCTWYVWYRAHQTYRGWGVKLPGWGNAKTWAKNAAKAGYKVLSKPKSYKEGYSIGCNTSGTYGHVAWIYDYDSNYVWVDEQNCCNCSVAGTRIGAKYKRSYFTYISR